MACHLLLTLIHFITWASAYGGVRGPGPGSAKVAEFDDIIVSLMSLAGWTSVLYFARGVEVRNTRSWARVPGARHHPHAGVCSASPLPQLLVPFFPCTRARARSGRARAAMLWDSALLSRWVDPRVAHHQPYPKLQPCPQYAGQLAVMVELCVVEVVKYCTIYLIFNIGFTLAFYTVLRGTYYVTVGGGDGDDAYDPAAPTLDNIGFTMIQLLRSVLRLFALAVHARRVSGCGCRARCVLAWRAWRRHSATPARARRPPRRPPSCCRPRSPVLCVCYLHDGAVHRRGKAARISSEEG